MARPPTKLKRGQPLELYVNVHLNPQGIEVADQGNHASLKAAQLDANKRGQSWPYSPFVRTAKLVEVKDMSWEVPK